MAKQSPKTRTTKTTKKKATTTTKKPVKSTVNVKPAAKAPKKPVAAAAANTRRLSRSSLTAPFRRNRGASVAKPVSTPSRGAAVTAASLEAWNKWLALLFAVQGVLILLLSNSYLLAVTTHYLALDTFASEGREVVRSTAQQHLFDVNLVYLLAAISFVFALSHLLGSTLLRKRYESQITGGASASRWATYALGYGLVAVVLSMLVGVNDISTLALIFLLTVTWSALGLGAEKLGKNAGTVYGVALAAFIAVWVVVAYYLLGTVLYDGSVPNYVYALAASTLVLSLIPLRIFMKQQKAVGKWANYPAAERAYMLATFVLVAAVTWQIFAGVLMP